MIAALVNLFAQHKQFIPTEIIRIPDEKGKAAAFPFCFGDSSDESIQMTENRSPVIPVFRDETVEDLQRSGYRMIQTASGFRFGEDSVLLAASAAEISPVRRSIQVADLGAGCGAVGLLLAARRPLLHVWAIELDPHRADCLERNIRLNRLEQRMTAIQSDVRLLASPDQKAGSWPLPLFPATCDLVLANPPYRKPVNSADEHWQTLSEAQKSRLMAVEEWTLDINRLMQASARLLKPGGTLMVVHRPQRLPDLMEEMRRQKLEPIRLQALESLPGKAPSRIIVTARYRGKPGGFRWLDPLQICHSPGCYTEHATALYGHEPSMNSDQLMRNIQRAKQNWVDSNIGGNEEKDGIGKE